MQSRGRRCCFLGYDGNTQFRVYDPATNKIKSNIRDIDFLENEFLEPSEFTNVPYAERPLQVPEPRNYTEFDEEPDEDLETGDMFHDTSDSEPPELVADINISALNFRLIGLVHLVEIRQSHVGFRPTLGLVSSGQTKGVLVFVGSPSR